MPTTIESEFNQSTAVRPGQRRPDAGAGKGWSRRRSAWLVAALIMAVIAIDQSAKWWAWRHAWSATINSGGDLLVGGTVGSWFADPFLGSVLDVVDSGALGFGLYLLLRRRTSTGTLVAGGLFLAGWMSNLLDRLGVHDWTAPSSGRGVVDFVPVGNQVFNLADLCIVAGTAGLALSAVRWIRRGSEDPVARAVLVETG